MTSDVATRALRVLVADDTPEIREMLRVTLGSDSRFVVVGEAVDGAQAVAMAVRDRPDLVVLDVTMPVLDGLEAIPRLRSAVPGIRIAVLSGIDATLVRDQALGLGADAYFEKGIAMRDLADALVELCGHEQGPPVPPAPVRAWWLPADVERAWSERMSLVAHELRTPVTVIRGFAATLRILADQDDPEARALAVEAIERNAAILAEMTGVLAELGPAEADALTVSPVLADASQIVGETLRDLEPMTGAHEVSFTPGEPVPVPVDALRLRQIVTNLLMNAVRYAPRGSVIDVTVESEADEAIVAVRDHGPGIAPHEHELAFAKFVRLQQGPGGTGLGLYLSRLLARAHGGDLRLTLPDGGGCRFELRLPR